MNTEPVRSPGRPREFVIDEALDRAVWVFRERGFNATSIVDLSEAMGLVTGSIYKAFRDKRGVFLAAFDRYAYTRTVQLEHLLNDGDKSGREKLRDFLMLYVDVSYGTDGRRGCLIVGSAVELSTFDAEVARRVKESLHRTESQIVRLVKEGKEDGSIPKSLAPKAAARLMLCLFQGLRVVGKVGATKSDMTGAADLAMSVFD